jgi:hypothetical protein
MADPAARGHFSQVLRHAGVHEVILAVKSWFERLRPHAVEKVSLMLCCPEICSFFWGSASAPRVWVNDRAERVAHESGFLRSSSDVV